MDHMEQMDLLKAIMTIAVADGEVRRSELGTARALAERLGIESVSFDAMLQEASTNDAIADNMFIGDQAKAHTAFELLVAQARIDGEISTEERALLVRMAKTLNIDDADFPVIYQAGQARADKLRKSREA